MHWAGLLFLVRSVANGIWLWWQRYVDLHSLYYAKMGTMRGSSTVDSRSDCDRVGVKLGHLELLVMARVQDCVFLGYVEIHTYTRKS